MKSSLKFYDLNAALLQAIALSVELCELANVLHSSCSFKIFARRASHDRKYKVDYFVISKILAHSFSISFNVGINSIEPGSLNHFSGLPQNLALL